jgi:hypothetical protein
VAREHVVMVATHSLKHLEALYLLPSWPLIDDPMDEKKFNGVAQRIRLIPDCLSYKEINYLEV